MAVNLLTVVPYGQNNKNSGNFNFHGLKNFKNPIKNKLPGPYGSLDNITLTLKNTIEEKAYKAGVSTEEWLRKSLGIPFLTAIAAVASKSANIGNSKVTTLIDGDQYFEKAMEFVSGAKDSIQLEMFEFQNVSVDGDYWIQGGAQQLPGGQQQQQLLWTLINKKKENPDMKIQVILDAHKWYMDSSSKDKKHYANQDMIKFLKDNDIDVVPYPRASQQGASLQHIKLLIADGEKAILGGMNWGSHSAVNHDGCVALEKLPDKKNSEVDNLIAQHFNPDWKLSWQRLGETELATGPLNELEQAKYNGINKEIKQENVEYHNLLKDYFNTPEAKNRYKNNELNLSEPKPITNPKIKVLGTKPRELEKVGENGIETTREYLMDKINKSKKVRAELFVLTDKELVQTIIKRFKEGKLDAKFIVESDIINKFPYCENAYDELTEAGIPVRVYKSNKTMNQRMHAKWAVFDDKEVMIGSTNWSAQGLNQNLSVGRREDYVLTTQKIDTRIMNSFKKVRAREQKLQLSSLGWKGDDFSYQKLKERVNVLRKAYNSLKKTGEASFELEGKNYIYNKNKKSVNVNNKEFNFKANDEKDVLAELRTVLGYYNIVKRRHLSKQRFMRGNNEIAVAFESNSLAKSVFIKQFDIDWNYSNSKYDEIKNKVIPINSFKKNIDLKG